MKALLLSGLLALGTLVSSAKAPRKSQTLNFRAQQNLQSLFGKVKNLSWTEVNDNLIRADFTSGEESMTMFFDENGEVKATTRQLKMEELPWKLRLDLDQRFSDATIVKMIECTLPSEQAYYIEIERNGKRSILKGYDYGRLSYAFLD